MSIAATETEGANKRPASRLAENTRRLRAWNRSLAAFRWHSLPEAVAPDPPRLIAADDTEALYQPRPAEGPRCPEPVGAGPDGHDYYLSASDPDGYSVGELFHSARTGGVYCRVETPLDSGGFGARWLRIT